MAILYNFRANLPIKSCSVFAYNTIFQKAWYTSENEEGERPFAPTDIYSTTSEHW
jgi:hypothetical protein